MEADASSPPDLSVRAVIVRALRRLPAETRRGMGLVLLAWLLVLALQVWDSSHRPDVRGFAELASIAFGTGGFLLISLVGILRRAQEPSSPAVRQMRIALPTLAVIAGALLGAGAAILVVRIWLGASPMLLVIGALYVMALAGAIGEARNAAMQLYAFGQQEAARVAQAEADLAQARIAALQAQMNPHFLFNALNTVAALVGTDPRAAETTVENLSQVLRLTLDRSEQTLGTVGEEIAYVRAYLAVEAQRFGERVSVDWQIAPEAPGASLPPLVIQPLVENALKHGIGNRREGGRLVIRAERQGSRLRVSVEDDGEGFSPGFQMGTGLNNLRRRLDAQFGTTAAIRIESRSKGACVAVELPYARAGR